MWRSSQMVLVIRIGWQPPRWAPRLAAQVGSPGFLQNIVQKDRFFVLLDAVEASIRLRESSPHGVSLTYIVAFCSRLSWHLHALCRLHRVVFVLAKPRDEEAVNELRKEASALGDIGELDRLLVP